MIDWKFLIIVTMVAVWFFFLGRRWRKHGMKWKHEIETRDNSDGFYSEGLYLDEKGADGWELTMVLDVGSNLHRYYFRRPVGNDDDSDL